MVDLQAQLRAALAGRFAVEEEVGRGGMSVVFRALDIKHARPVALKVLRPELSALLGAERFHREVEFAARLSNPYILPLFDSGEIDTHLFYVMPLVTGGSLEDLIEREGPLDVERALGIAWNVASALAAAHAAGIVHRDVKPGNILFSGGQAVVADFGIARALAFEDGARLTRSGISVGSPAFMSPEQALGDDVDGRSDLYSLGCVLYYMLTGHPPFQADSAQALITAKVTQSPPSARDERPEVSRTLDELVRTALQPLPTDRFASAHEMVQALEHPELMPGRARARRRRRIARISGLVAAACVVVAALAYVSWRAFGPEPLVAADPNGVMVFPIVDLTRDGRLQGQGSGLAAGVGYALGETEPLRWLDGWDWLGPGERSDPGELTTARMREIARRQGAGYFISGTAVDQADSVALVLRLFDSRRRGPQVARSGQTLDPTSSSISRATIRAVAGLLPTIVGEPVDVSSLSDRDVRALANWTIGLSRVRDAQFESAYEHFQTALGQDSLLVLAAVDGALAAMWISKINEAQKLADAALAHDTLLSPRYLDYAHGIRFYTLGRADSTVARMRASLRADTTWSEAWFALGEAFLTLLPSQRLLSDVAAEIGSPPIHTAVAEAAFRTSLVHDPTYSPSLARLADVALIDDDLPRADSLLERFFVVDPDSLMVLHHTLVLRCSRGDMNADDWRQIATERPLEAVRAAVVLSRTGRNHACAEQAYRAAFASTAATDADRWGVIVGLQSLLVAQGRDDELIEFLATGPGATLGGQYLFALDAAAGADTREQARNLAASVGSDYESQAGPVLWVNGEAAALVDDAAALAAISAVLEHRVLASGTVLDSLLAGTFAAHLAVAQGDTAEAIRLFGRLEPRGDRRALQWNPWATLAPERLRLSELLVAAGRPADALKVAAMLDHPQPVVYLAFQPASLAIRARAYDALGNAEAASTMRAQMRSLSAAPEALDASPASN